MPFTKLLNTSWRYDSTSSGVNPTLWIKRICCQRIGVSVITLSSHETGSGGGGECDNNNKFYCYYDDRKDGCARARERGSADLENGGFAGVAFLR